MCPAVIGDAHKELRILSISTVDFLCNGQSYISLRTDDFYHTTSMTLEFISFLCVLIVLWWVLSVLSLRDELNHKMDYLKLPFVIPEYLG